MEDGMSAAAISALKDGRVWAVPVLRLVIGCRSG